MKKGKLYIVIRSVEDDGDTYVNGPAADALEAAKWYRKLVKHEEFEADSETPTIEFLTKSEVKALEAESISPIDDVLTPYVEEEDTDEEEVEPEVEDEEPEEDEEEPEPEPKPAPKRRSKPAATPKPRPRRKPAARPRRRAA